MFNFQTKLNNAAGAAGRLSAEEFNNFIRELENLVTFGKLILSEDPANVTQIAEAVAIAARSAGLFIDVGSENQVRLTPLAGANTFPLPSDYTALDANAATFRVVTGNTGAATLDIGMAVGSMMGARGLVRPDGSPLQAGDLKAGDYVTAVYDASLDKWRLTQLGLASEQDLEDHVQDTGNPHQVTPGQIGAATSAALNAHVNNTNNPHNVTLGQLGGAPLNSPAFTGNPTAPTPASNDADNSVATTGFTQAAIQAALVAGGLAGGFTQSFGTNGWSRMPNGLILQWGRVLGGGGEGTGPNVTFPIAFPNNCLSVTAMDWNRNASAQWIWIDCFVQVVSVSPTQFSTFVQNPGSNQNNWDGFFWMAVGF